MKDHSAPPAATPTSSRESTLPPVPEYTPMTSYYLLHLAHTRLPTSFLNLNHVSHASIFRFILSDSLLSTICKNTNSYTQEKRDTTGMTGRGWSSMQVGYLKMWFGIVIYMEIFSAPAWENY